ncbi:MAG: LytR C-terminal domain-containing protein [Myxococcaceae bacterium]
MTALLLSLCLQVTTIDPGFGATFVGWSADGEFLVFIRGSSTSSAAHHYFRKENGKKVEVPQKDVLALSEAERKQLLHTIAEQDEMGGGETQVDERASLAVVHSLKTGKDTLFLLALEQLTVQAKGELKKKYAGLGDAAAFDAWKAAAKLSKTSGLEGPGGATASVTANGKATLKWEADDTAVVFTLARGPDKAIHAYTDPMAAMYVAKRSVTVWWSADGRRAMFETNTAEAQTMRGVMGAESKFEVFAVPPRLEVVAGPLAKNEADRVVTVLEGAGFTVSQQTPAVKERTATVIYADAAHQDLAKKVAAALPGATVDKLTWKANGEIVVAVGVPK